MLTKRKATFLGHTIFRPKGLNVFLFITSINWRNRFISCEPRGDQNPPGCVLSPLGAYLFIVSGGNQSRQLKREKRQHVVQARMR